MIISRPTPGLFIAATCALFAASASHAALPPPQYLGYAGVSVTLVPPGGRNVLTSSAGVLGSTGAPDRWDDFIDFPISDRISAGMLPGAAYWNADAQGYYAAGAGTLHASALAHENGAAWNTNVSASAEAGYTDYVLVQGPGDGSTGDATLQFTLAVDGLLYSNNLYLGGNDSAHMHAALDVRPDEDSSGANGDGEESGCGLLCGSDDFVSMSTPDSYADNHSRSFSVTVPYDTVLSVTGLLSVDAFVLSDPGYDYGNAFSSNSDYSNTMHTWIDVLTPGVSLLASSGHDYGRVAAVPEPDSYALMLAGLGVVGLMLRRRRRGAGSLSA